MSTEQNEATRNTEQNGAKRSNSEHGAIRSKTEQYTNLIGLLDRLYVATTHCGRGLGFCLHHFFFLRSITQTTFH